MRRDWMKGAVLGAMLFVLTGGVALASESCCSPVGEHAAGVPGATHEEPVPVVEVPPVLVTPALEAITRAKRIVKRGVASEVLEFLRRMHRRITESQEYPFTAVKLGLQGTTTVKISLLPDGQAESVRVRKSSGHRLLDEAALDAVHRVLPLVPPPEAGDQLLEVDVPISFALR